MEEDKILEKLNNHDKKFEEHDTKFVEIDERFDEVDKQLAEQKIMIDILIENSATKDDLKNTTKELKTAIDTLTVTINEALQEIKLTNANSKIHTDKNLKQDDRIEKCEEDIVVIKKKLQMAV